MPPQAQPLFKKTIPRGAGVLLHPTSLPSLQGIGSLGESARAFIDFLSESGFRYWQVCPLGPTGYGDSPYQCFSAFAGNPYLIDTEALIALKLLTEENCAPLRELPSEHADFGRLYNTFWPVLIQSYENFKKDSSLTEQAYGSFHSFKKAEQAWLYPYCCFRAIKRHFEDKPYREWPSEYRTFSKAYAQSKEVSIIGDIPIFVSEDSADIWANPEIFSLDKDGAPTHQAGVPPDYFSEDGQLFIPLG